MNNEGRHTYTPNTEHKSPPRPLPNRLHRMHNHRQPKQDAEDNTRRQRRHVSIRSVYPVDGSMAAGFELLFECLLGG